jgi:hypothetical protein
MVATRKKKGVPTDQRTPTPHRQTSANEPENVTEALASNENASKHGRNGTDSSDNSSEINRSNQISKHHNTSDQQNR